MKKLRAFLCGLLAISIFVISVPAIAETIQVTFNTMIIDINDQKVNEKGQSYTLPNGDKTPFSMVYKGTTYLPLRKLVELLGKDLTFDGATSTVYIKDKVNSDSKPVIKPETSSIDPVDEASIQAVFNEIIVNINGYKVNEKGQNFKLENGDKVPFSIVYNGTTYLPLRKLVDLLGKDLTLDGETSTVYIKDREDLRTNSRDYEIEWEDPAFESLVRKLINKPEGVINRSELENITSLDIYGDNISTIKPLEVMRKNPIPNIKSPIKSINDISHFKNLNWLCIYGHPISDVTPLTRLGKLTELHLIANKIYSIGALSNSRRLTTLNVSYNRITDINPVVSLKNITQLHLISNSIEDISPLKSLTKLKVLNLDNNNIIDISVLSELKNLNWLVLDNNQIRDISTLEKLTEIRGLSVCGNRIIDISPLAALEKLEILKLNNNLIRDINTLTTMKTLTELYISGNRIVDVAPLSTLTNLTNLELAENFIKDIRPLQILTNLKRLSLEANFITDINSLSALTNLTELYLDNNPYSDAGNYRGGEIDVLFGR